ncbi:hypothetical protein [Streptomyces cuspidosporus]|uniref:Aromatic ring-opening dioxygenase LigA n=1 Tax=Streptomyces cuspidosporus TaxID=66882 RepID=A0ABN3G8U8_9ACTN
MPEYEDYDDYDERDEYDTRRADEDYGDDTYDDRRTYSDSDDDFFGDDLDDFDESGESEDFDESDDYGEPARRRTPGSHKSHKARKTHKVTGAPTGSGGSGGSGEEPSAPAGGKRKRFTWKTILLTIVACALVGSLVQMVARGGFGGSLGTSGGGGGHKKSPAQEQEVRPSTKPKTIRLGNQRVPQTSGPIIVINPGLVAPGGKASVEGGGFEPKSTVDLLLKTKRSDTKGRAIRTVRTDKHGSLYTNFTMPESLGGKPGTLVAQQRGGGRSAEAELISGGAIGTARINKTVGRPGDVVSISARGFKPGEQINVFWGRTTGTPVARLRTDSSGGVGRADIRVGVAPTGQSTLVLVGQQSKTTATAPFQMLSLYPAIKSSPYALKAGQRIRLSGNRFAPNERVLVYINATSGLPAFTTQANSFGQLRDVAFDVPFGLKGRQSLTAIGDQSRAVTRSGFTVLPYSPSAEPSTFGGKAGTTLSFYCAGFAPNETVTVYAGNGSVAGRKIATFQVDGRGKAAAVGSYRITPADEGGVSFKLIGSKSGGVAKAGINYSQGQGH